jgi:hypothetical protein
MSKSIQITVSPTGGTKIETTGFTGSACQDATRALEAALGATANEQMTSEFYTEAPEQTNELHQ